MGIHGTSTAAEGYGEEVVKAAQRKHQQFLEVNMLNRGTPNAETALCTGRTPVSPDEPLSGGAPEPPAWQCRLCFAPPRIYADTRNTHTHRLCCVSGGSNPACLVAVSGRWGLLQSPVVSSTRRHWLISSGACWSSGWWKPSFSYLFRFWG